VYRSLPIGPNLYTAVFRCMFAGSLAREGGRPMALPIRAALSVSSIGATAFGKRPRLPLVGALGVFLLAELAG
jgi:hypothetical protein